MSSAASKLPKRLACKQSATEAVGVRARLTPGLNDPWPISRPHLTALRLLHEHAEMPQTELPYSA